MIFKFIIGLGMVISILMIFISIFSDFSYYLIPSLKTKYTMKTEISIADSGTSMVNDITRTNPHTKHTTTITEILFTGHGT